jgi:hypothetical protein
VLDLSLSLDYTFYFDRDISIDILHRYQLGTVLDLAVAYRLDCYPSVTLVFDTFLVSIQTPISDLRRPPLAFFLQVVVPRAAAYLPGAASARLLPLRHPGWVFVSESGRH